MKTMMLAAAAVLTLATPALAQETVRIATEGAYAPWNFLDDSGAPAGYEIDLTGFVPERVIDAMIRSYHGDEAPLRALIIDAIDIP